MEYFEAHPTAAHLLARLEATEDLPVQEQVVELRSILATIIPMVVGEQEGDEVPDDDTRDFDVY